MSCHKKFVVLALLSLLLASLTAAVGAQAPRSDPWVKVDPRVRQLFDGADEAEFLVVLGEQADVSGARLLSGKEEKGWYVYRTLQETAERGQREIRTELEARGVPYRAYYIVNMIWVQAAGSDLLLDLAGRPEVDRIILNPYVQGIPDPLDQGEGIETIEWNIAQVHAPEVWAMGYSGQGAVVAGNDTGIDWDHPALINQYRPAYPSYGRHDFNWHDAVANQQVPYDGYGHGTHTLGTIVGDDGGDNQVGMAPGAQWIGCKNMDDSGYGTPTRYIECFEFFLAPYAWNDPASADPAKAPHVINNSWSCPASEGCDPDTLEWIVDNLRTAGIEVVVSAGNSGSSCGTVNNPPAIYQQSFTVGATTSINNIAGFSSRGPTTYSDTTYLKPNISAPGSGVRSSIPGGGYGSMSGTSMAAPHVAGLVALLISADPSLAGNPDAIEYIITSTALPKVDAQCGDPGPPNNVYGWGIIDALAAVETVLSQGGLQGIVTDIESGGPIEAATIHMVNEGGGSYQVSTDAGGYYTRTVLPGTYTVTASAYGYISVVFSDVLVVTDTVTTQDFALLAALAFEPAPLHVFVLLSGTHSSAVTLSNRLATPYDFEFYEIPGGFIPTTQQPQAAWPGPDGYGYTGEAADYDWIDISASGTPVPLSDDDYAGPFALGFSFPLYGTDYAQFYVGSNGFVSFGGGSIDMQNDSPLPNGSTPNNIVALMWDDLNPASGGNIYYQSFGSCPIGAGSCTVVAYHNVPHYGGSDAGTFEAVLFDNGSVLLQYEDAGSEAGSGSTTGIEGNDAAADYGLTYACDTGSSLGDGDALCFVYPGSPGCVGVDVPWLGQEPISGTVPAGGSLNLTVHFTATPAVGVDQPGDYYADMVVNGNPKLRVPVTMTVITGCLPVDILTVTVVVTGCQVNFSGELDGLPPFDYVWHFGDGLSSTVAAPSHVYSASGSYTTTLEVWNCAGAYSDSQLLALTVTCEAPCAPVEILSVTAEISACQATFGADLAGDEPFETLWSFGDGLTSTLAAPSHVYTSSGTYTTTLEVWNCAGAYSDSQLLALTVTCEAPCASVEILSVTAEISACQATFGADLAGDEPFETLWSFGDGLSSTLAAPVHVYSASGTYSYTLTARNCANVYSDTHTDEVTVECAAECIPVTQTNFSWSPPTPTLGQVVVLTATAEGTPAIVFSWDLGDDISATGAVVQHVYAAAGTYTVTVVASNRCGDEVVQHALAIVQTWRVYLPLLFK